MPKIMCPNCLAEFEINKKNYEGEIECSACGAVIHVKIEEGKLEQTKLAAVTFEPEPLFEGEEEEELEDW